MKNYINNLAKSIEKANSEPTDYVNEIDNLMYCGKCHTPKQKRFEQPIFDKIDKVPIPCQCRSKEIEEERVQDKLRKHYQNVE